MDFLKDLWGFLKNRKKFWLFPAIIILVFLGFIIVVAGGSVVTPLIYALF